jgi:hypothetical protein
VLCLVVNGQYDHCGLVSRPVLHEPRRFKFDSKGSSHTPTWEDRARYIWLVDEFLDY